jgi:hypothetical protein
MRNLSLPSKECQKKLSNSRKERALSRRRCPSVLRKQFHAPSKLGKGDDILSISDWSELENNSSRKSCPRSCNTTGALTSRVASAFVEELCLMLGCEGGGGERFCTSHSALLVLVSVDCGSVVVDEREGIEALSGKLRSARQPRIVRAALSYANAASSAVSNVPSQQRAPCLAESLISAANFPHGRCRTPR